MTTQLTKTRTAEESIAQSIIPYNRDDSRARYLGLRASGFTIREALKIVGCAHSTLSYWRLDPQFIELENRLPEFRRELALEYANIEFIRNYRMILEKDYQVIRKSLNPERNEDGKTAPMEKQDHEYLLKLRSHYTPQQLQVIETLMSASNNDQQFNFTEFVLTASKEIQRVQISAKSRAASSEESDAQEV